MNWSFLHTGPAGVAEAALIALVLGLLGFFGFHRLGRRLGWQEAGAFGWACLFALLLGGGLDFFHLLRLFLLDTNHVRRIQLALQGIHDPQWLGVRFLAEVLGALAGALAGWALAQFRRRRGRGH